MVTTSEAFTPEYSCPGHEPAGTMEANHHNRHVNGRDLAMHTHHHAHTHLRKPKTTCHVEQ